MIRPLRFQSVMFPLASSLVLLVCLTGLAPTATAEDRASLQDPDRFALSDKLRLHVVQGRDLVLEYRAERGDTWYGLADRLCGSGSAAEQLQAANDRGGDGRLRYGQWVRVPLPLLDAHYRSLVLRSLFPQDRRTGQGWLHVARSGHLPTFDEGLWQVAEWFVGDGGRFVELLEPNGLSSPELRQGQSVLIPNAVLHPAFAAVMISEDGSLEYDKDAGGPYAGYRLRPGEALYSSVIVRFTGRTRAEDVNEVAEALRARSGIHDLTDIPVGFLVKIPFDLLEPQYLPAEHPRRRQAEADQAEIEAEAARAATASSGRGLEGVLVVIDPGHGGNDLGTRHNGVWEHDYVYDLSCRLRERLERETRAEVRMTLLDTETGCEPSSGDKLQANKKGSVMTDPPFLATKSGDSRISANLRWYLANSIYREALDRGIDKDRIVFLSIHADARHPSLRGLMVYLPGAAYRTKRYGKSGKPYSGISEVRQKQYVSFSKKQRVHSEAVSKRLAEQIVDSFEGADLPVQPHQPIRNRIVRRNSRYVPAVIRANEIPTKVLVEVLNMRNGSDAKLIGKAENRTKMADALLDALFRHYGETPPQ